MSDIGTHAPYTRGPPPRGQQPAYEFSADEKRVMQECRSESFWYRALPMSAGAALLTRTMISRGILTAGTRFGSAPKVAFAALFGYMTGKGSYVFKCQEKIMRLENSQLAEALRKKRMPGSSPADGGGIRQGSPPPMAPQESYESYSVPLSGTQVNDAHVNLDIDTSNVKNIDDYEPLQEGDPNNTIEEKPKMTTTYEDLRNQSRRNVPTFGSRSQAPPPGSPPAGPASQEASQAWEQDRRWNTSPTPNRQQQEEFPLGRSRKNKYGDEWA